MGPCFSVSALFKIAHLTRYFPERVGKLSLLLSFYRRG